MLVCFFLPVTLEKKKLCENKKLELEMQQIIRQVGDKKQENSQIKDSSSKEGMCV